MFPMTKLRKQPPVAVGLTLEENGVKLHKTENRQTVTKPPSNAPLAMQPCVPVSRPLVKNICFRKIPSFSVQMLSNVRILCDYLRKILFFYVYLTKNRTLLDFCTVYGAFFLQSHNSGQHLLKK